MTTKRVISHAVDLESIGFGSGGRFSGGEDDFTDLSESRENSAVIGFQGNLQTREN